MASYAEIAGVDPVWTTGQATVAGRTLHTETLATDPALSLVFLQLPDGDVDGSGLRGRRRREPREAVPGPHPDDPHRR
ncbi:hypothetical protein Q9Q99_05395 [Curtobacterium flaccumfaciens]|nr:hypothetical protein Q9Q99_05395 [Curtobacterium flaccumfaciens]